MTAVVIDLAAQRAVRRPAPAEIVTSVCVTLHCHGLLTYQAGQWLHVGAGCNDAQPATCQHPTCTETAEIEQPCAARHDHCCGCCWILDDDLEGRQLWPTN